MRIALPAIGQSYRHASLPLSAQVTRNWFPEINIESSRALSLQPFPGATVFSRGNGNFRGTTVWRDMLYQVAGWALYSIDKAGVQTVIGAIGGSAMCSFATSSEHMVIVSEGKAFRYSGTTLSQITDVDLEKPNYGTYLNNQWIYQGEGSRFAVSDAGQPVQINGLNYATAESEGDDLVRPYVYRQLLYLFGEKSIESWYNSGVGNPPFDRVEGGIIQKGLAAADSISHNDNFLYFLGDDRHIYQMADGYERSISTIPLVQAFEGYSEVEIAEAIGFCYSMAGQNFYHILVGGTAWVFNESAGGWFEATVGVDEDPHPAKGAIHAYGRHLIFDEGDVFELGGDLYDGQPMIRERVTGLVSGELLGAEYIGRPLFMSRAEIIIKGEPPLGDAPQIMLSWSDDAGYTWSSERIIECGEQGNYTFKAVSHSLGRFYERVFRIRISDESNFAIYSMTGDIDAGN